MVIARTDVVVCSARLMRVAVRILGARRSSIGCPKTTKSRRVHLLLQKIARICIMNVGVVLKTLNQVGRIA